MKHFFFLLSLLATVGVARSQQIWHQNFAGPDTTLACGVSCINYNTTVPEIRTTENYVVGSIPYTPYPFVTTSPALTLPCANQDDKFFDASNLGFTFCFYGRSYTQLVVGTNGLVTFDLTNAVGCNHYSLTTAGPIPFTGPGAQCFTNCPDPSGLSLYPRASIFGAYHDIFIDGTSANKKMEFRVEGVAPSRRAVISFNQIPLFSCVNSLATHQIVIYEATGIVEVYLKDKPICTTFNGGRALVGIQNFERNAGLAPPGRNLGQWGSNNMNEAWRFTPNGAVSRLSRVELLLNNAVVANGTLGTSANGTVGVSFPNICPPADNNAYVVRAFYRTCDNDNTLFSVDDTVNINKRATIPIDGSITPATCLPNATGSITVTNPVGAGFQYSSDGVTFQNSPTFNLVPGTYTIYVRDQATGCVDSRSFTINTNSTLAATATTINASCPGSLSGSITVNATQGTPGYQYAIEGGIPGNSNVFPNLADGTYNVTVIDAAGCAFNFTATVGAGAGFTASVTTTNAACAGSATGSAVVTAATNAAPPVTYSFQGGPFTPNNSFINLLGGQTYNVVVRDGNGCTTTVPIRINNNAGISGTFTTSSAACTGSPSGSVTLQPSANAVSPISYALGTGSPQGSPSFSGLIGGASLNFTITDGAGCTASVPVTVPSGAGITATAATQASACAGSPTGSLTISPSANALAPISYTLNAGTPQASPTFGSLLGGTPYTIVVQDGNSCQATVNVTIPNGPGITATAATQPSACAGSPTGSLTVTPSNNALAPISYTLNAGAPQASPTFGSLLGGTPYSIVVLDGNSCQTTVNVTVPNGPGITLTGTATPSACAGSPTGSISLTPSTNALAPFSFTLNSGTAQTASTFGSLLGGTSYNMQVTDANGCAANAAIAVPNGPGITATASATSAACVGSNSGTVTVTPAGGINPYAFSIDNGTNFQPSNSFGGLPGGASYTVLVRDGNGCTTNVSVTVNNSPGVTATASTLPSACTGASTGVILVQTTLGLAPFRYSLNGGITTQDSGIFRNLAAQAYTVRVLDALNCFVDVPVTVANRPALTATAIPSVASCAPIANGRITVNATQGVLPLLYILDTGTPQLTNQFNNLATGTYNVSVVDSAGCSATVTNVVVGLAPRIRPTLAIVRPSCNGLADGRITVTATLGTSPYEFALDGGPFSSNNVFNNITARPYTVSVRDQVGCQVDTLFTVTQPGNLAIAPGTTTRPTCTGNPDGVIRGLVAGGTAPFEYTLNPADPVGWQSANSFNVVAGFYTITVRDNNGCTATTNITATLNDTMRLELGPDTSACAGTGITLVPNTNAQTNVFDWTPGLGLSDSTIRNPVALPNDTTRYVLVARWGVCERRDTITVSVRRRPIVDAGRDTAICVGGQAPLLGLATNLSGSVSYTWTPADSLNRTDTPRVVANPIRTTRYFLTVRDNYNCNFVITDSALVTVQPPIQAFAGNDTIAVQGLPHQLNATGGFSYQWTPTNVLNNPSIPNPRATLQNDTRFVVRVADQVGCFAFDTVFVKVFVGPTYYLPNAFSPNGDGLNEMFRPLPVGIDRTEYFRIFNRYGQLIFETNRYREGWDGTFKGVKQNPGAYVWVIKGIDRNGRSVTQQGTVMLVR
jgi:gliding motility-associated-like protein